LIEHAYTMGESLGLAVWTYDEAGPFQPKPCAGQSWQENGQPLRQAHEYLRQGTAKLLCLFHPADGQVRAKGVTRCSNTVLHTWLKEELTAVLAALPPAPEMEGPVNRGLWQRWQEGLQRPITLAADLPPLRALLVMDNLAGHRTPEFVLWLFAHGIMPLYTPLSGSWLNMAESVQRIIKRRALEGQHPQTPAELIALLEATVRGWNRAPTPFVWGGARRLRRVRSRQRRHRLGGSGACMFRPLRRRRPLLQQWLQK
jgi:DDE superfamily endonuclease